MENKSQEKEKIRSRYNAEHDFNAEIIPPKIKTPTVYDDLPKRIAIYARVSTDSLQQTSSYELQKNYYDDFVARNPSWELVKIYADEGISGTSMKNRDAFNSMISDCRDGKIDMIITKSVSRFARNIVDCISVLRELEKLKPPIGVYFETEGLFSLNDKAKLALNFTVTLAEEESHAKSNVMKHSYQMHVRAGLLAMPKLIGYDKTEDKNLSINAEEAQTIRIIYFMYLYGCTLKEIAETLSKTGRKTKLGNTDWSEASIASILRNEKFCGQVLTQKTYTPSYIDHKSRVNRGEFEQQRWHNHHEAIISPADWVAVQRLMDNAKYGYRKGVLPTIKVIHKGALKGFVTIHPKWAGFSAEDYKTASLSAYENNIFVDENLDDMYETTAGEFDFRGFEIARSQFFDMQNRVWARFSVEELKFNIHSIRKLDCIKFIELLIHPFKKLMVIRAVDGEKHTAIKWNKIRDGQSFSTCVSGAAYLKTIFELLQWSTNLSYRVSGFKKGNELETVLVYNLEEAELIVPETTFDEKNDNSDEILPMIKSGKSVSAYPTSWASSFGYSYYSHAQAEELGGLKEKEDWKLFCEGRAFGESDEDVTSPEEAEEIVEEILSDLDLYEVQYDE